MKSYHSACLQDLDDLWWLFARRILYCCRSCIIFTAVRSTLLLLHFQLHSLCFCNQPVSAWFCCMLWTGQLLGMLGIKIISYNIYRYKTLRANIILYFFACKATHLIGCWVAASLWLVWLVWLVTLCDVTFSSFFHMWLQPGATVSLIYCIAVNICYRIGTTSIIIIIISTVYIYTYIIYYIYCCAISNCHHLQTRKGGTPVHHAANCGVLHVLEWLWPRGLLPNKLLLGWSWADRCRGISEEPPSMQVTHMGWRSVPSFLQARCREMP